MRDILSEVDEWSKSGQPVALATVIHTWGSSPRGVGAKMALTPDGKMAGSVSGGCVESAVFEAGVESLQTRRPQLLKFGIADETAWEVGLSCGGQIEVFVQPLERDFFEATRAALHSGAAFSTATIVAGPAELMGREMLIDEDGVNGELPAGLAERVVEKARLAMAAGRSGQFKLEAHGEQIEVFVEVVNPPPTLIMVGGVHIAIALASLAKTLGYRTVLVDPRRSFGSAERFPHVDELIQAWPQEAFADLRITGETAIAMLTHDPKIDDPALKIVLDSPAFYIGALGSRKTQEKRRRRLLEAGLSSQQLDRLHGPIGLEIGAQTPEEIALSVIAEVVAARRGALESPA